MSKRPYKPTALRALEGGRSNSLPRPEDVAEPKPESTAPPVPRELDTRAKKVWKDLAPKLERLGLLTEIDGGAFAILCQSHGFIAQLHEDLRQLKIFDDQKMKKISEVRQLYQVYRQFAAEFGCRTRFGFSRCLR